MQIRQKEIREEVVGCNKLAFGKQSKDCVVCRLHETREKPKRRERTKAGVAAQFDGNSELLKHLLEDCEIDLADSKVAEITWSFGLKHHSYIQNQQPIPLPSPQDQASHPCHLLLRGLYWLPKPPILQTFTVCPKCRTRTIPITASDAHFSFLQSICRTHAFPDSSFKS